MNLGRIMYSVMFGFLVLGLLCKPAGAVEFDPVLNLSNTFDPTTFHTNRSRLPSVAVVGDNVYVAWFEETAILVPGQNPQISTEVRFRSSTDGGQTFAEGPSGKVIATGVGSDIGTVRVAAFGNNVYVLFGTLAVGGGPAATLLRSTDGGAEFSSTTVPVGKVSPDMAVDGAGNIHVLSPPVLGGRS